MMKTFLLGQNTKGVYYMWKNGIIFFKVKNLHTHIENIISSIITLQQYQQIYF